MFDQITDFISKARQLPISDDRKKILQSLIQYIEDKRSQKEPVNLNFICTHNSRRSQFAQIWAQTVADHFQIPVNCYSGGVEVTAFNERAVKSIERAGFQVTGDGGDNPKYSVKHSDDGNVIIAFSKLFDDPYNQADHFAAVMTCSHADENCPFIPGTEKRISVNYEDPKEFDGTSKESEKYDERSMQIASEMYYVFSKINNSYS